MNTNEYKQEVPYQKDNVKVIYFIMLYISLLSVII